MKRIGTDDSALSYRCCLAALLELHNRELESRCEQTLADRGFFELTVPLTTNPLVEETSGPYARFGFWVLRGAGDVSIVMNGRDVVCVPWRKPEGGPYKATFLVPYNPIFIRPHRKP